MSDALFEDPAVAVAAAMNASAAVAETPAPLLAPHEQMSWTAT